MNKLTLSLGAFVIVRVEQMVGLLTQRFLQKLVVKLFDLRIVVRFPKLLPGVFFVDRVDTRQTHGIIRIARLTSTADTAARASHNLNKMIMCLTGLDLV